MENIADSLRDLATAAYKRRKTRTRKTAITGFFEWCSDVLPGDLGVQDVEDFIFGHYCPKVWRDQRQTWEKCGTISFSFETYEDGTVGLQCVTSGHWLIMSPSVARRAAESPLLAAELPFIAVRLAFSAGVSAAVWNVRHCLELIAEYEDETLFAGD